jgi:hypothetical protein
MRIAGVSLGEFALRLVLVGGGFFILYTGLDAALGGIATMGWQNPKDFFIVTNEPVFHIHDSHSRFLGGLWTGVGILFLYGAMKLHQVKPVLYAACLLIFMGGLARFSSGHVELLFGPDLVGALAAEIILMPVLVLWLMRTGAKT